MAGRAAGSGEVDRFPTFRAASNPGAQTYTVGTAIDALTLPAASGGNGTLAYSLAPNVPGLTFNATARQLTGTPSTAGTYAMTYTVTDEDGDTDTLGFTITVNTDTTETGSLGECYVSLSVSIGQSCTYPGTTDAFSVNDRGRGSFLTFLAGIRIRITNQTINGRVYDFEASHQGDGVWRIDRVAGSTEAPETPPTTGGGGMVDGDDDNDLVVQSLSIGDTSLVAGESFTLSATVRNLGAARAAATTLRYYRSTDAAISTADTELGTDAVRGLAAAAASNESITLTAPSTAGTYYYGACVDPVSGESNSQNNCSTAVRVAVSASQMAIGGFDLDSVSNPWPTGIVFANDRFFVVDWIDDKVYAYQSSGQRDSASDFDLDSDNGNASGIVFANNKLQVVDWTDDKVYAYQSSGQRDSASDFDLDSANDSPEGITFANEKFYVVDNVDAKVYVYQSSGQRDSASDFDLDSANDSPEGITFANEKFYVVDNVDAKVYAYQSSGQRDSASDFDLDSDNGNATGITFADNKFYVVDWFDDKVYSYSAGAAPGTTNNQPSFGTATVSNRTYTVGTAINALTLPAASGGDGMLTFSLSPNVPGLTFNATTRQLTGTPSTAGTYAMTYTVTDEDGDTDTLSFTITVDGSETRYEVGDTVTAWPTGVWFPDVLGAGVSFGYSGGIAVISFNNGGYIEQGGFRYTCASTGGCEVSNGEVLTGTIVEVSTGNNGVPPQDNHPDLVVESLSVSEMTLNAGESFTLNATVRNQGAGQSAATTLRYYRSSDATITTGDTEVGTDAISALAASSTSNQSISLTAPPTAGTYSYYGACVDPVSGETDTGNNCSTWVIVVTLDSRITIDSFDLDADNDLAEGITFANDRFYVVNRNAKVYAYQPSGQRDAAFDFDLDAATTYARGITFANDRFYVAGSGKVYAYHASGQRDAASDFDLDHTPGGITFANGRFYLVGWFENKVRAYHASGQRDAASDFHLEPDNDSPLGITFANDRFYVVDVNSRRIYAYHTSGEHDAASDIDYDPDLTNVFYPSGIAFANDRLYVVDNENDKVYVYDGTSSAGGDGSATRYEVGDVVTTLPTGTWFPDLTGGSVSFRISGGSAAIDFGNGGYIEEGSNRYTCASAGGCQVRGREVRAGTIVETPSGVAPEEIPPTSGTAGTCEVDLGRSTGAGGTETVSVALSDALETDVGSVDTPFIVRARMDSASDFDVYKIVLSEAGLLVVLSSGALDTQAVFLRSDCTEAGRVVEDVGVGEGFAANNYNFTLGGDLDPGTYYMVVFEWASRIGNYALELGFASDEVGNDTPVIEPVAHQEVAPGGTVTVDVQITDDTGDAHAVVATSDNEDVATADLRGSGSSRSLVINAQAAGTATITLRAADQEDAVASPITFDVIVASPTLPAPALEPGSNDGDLEVTVVTMFDPRETRAHDYQIRVKRPQTPWHTVGCHAITNNSDSTAAGPFSVTLGNNPAGLTYDVRYRYRNSSSCNTGSPGPWSAVGEGTSSGTAANATPAFPEGASTNRSVYENVGGGINVGSPVAASDADGVRDVLTYSLGGADAGSFQIVPATGQIRTRDGVTYDHEARDTFSVTVEARDVHSETDLISVDIHIVDLGSICASPPRLRLNSGDGELTVRWGPLADQAGSASVLGYEVERRDGTGGAWGSRQIIGGRAMSNMTYTGLVNGRQYDVRIRPFGNEDPCDWSTPVSGIPTTDTAPQDESDFEDRVPPGTQLRDWRFPVPGRFSEMRDGRQLDGSYRYVRTDPDRGTITFEYDEIGQSGCEVSLLFSSLTSGSFLDECEGAGVNVDVDFDIEEPPAPSSPLAPQTMGAFDALALGNDNLVPGFHFGEYFRGFGGSVSGVVSSYRGVREGVRESFRLGNYTYESTGAASSVLTVRFGCRCPRDEWDDNSGTANFPNEEWVFELSFLSPDAAEYTVTIYREGQPPLTLNGFIDFKAGDNLSSFPPELLPPGSPPQASGNDLFGVDAATGSTSLSIGGDSLQTILVQDGGIQDIAYQPGDWLEPKDGGNQRMMIVGSGQTGAPVAAGLVFRARTPAQANSAAQPVMSVGQTGLIALSVVCMQIEKGIPARGSRFFSQPKSPDGAVQMCQRNCVVAGGDTIQSCVWECEGSAESATSIVDDFGDSAMRQLLDALGGSSASGPIGTGVRSRSNDLKTALPRID